MFKVQLITVGKLKEKYWREAQQEYQKRLSAFCQLEIVELPEARLPDSPSEKQIEAALSQEAAAMEKYISAPHSHTIALCVEGKQMPSEKLSRHVSGLPIQGISALNLVIGSSYGLHPRIKQAADLRLSMSEMTLPHQLARIVLLEQLYRAYMIAANREYHK